MLSWFNIRSINITNTFVTVYVENANVTNNTIEYNTFDVMVSCVDKKYFEIVNWEYTGPRMIANVTNFFNLTLSSTP